MSLLLSNTVLRWSKPAHHGSHGVQATVCLFIRDLDLALPSIKASVAHRPALACSNRGVLRQQAMTAFSTVARARTPVTGLSPWQADTPPSLPAYQPLRPLQTRNRRAQGSYMRCTVSMKQSRVLAVADDKHAWGGMPCQSLRLVQRVQTR